MQKSRDLLEPLILNYFVKYNFNNPYGAIRITDWPYGRSKKMIKLEFLKMLDVEEICWV